MYMAATHEPMPPLDPSYRASPQPQFPPKSLPTIPAEPTPPPSQPQTPLPMNGADPYPSIVERPPSRSSSLRNVDGVMIPSRRSTESTRSTRSTNQNQNPRSKTLPGPGTLNVPANRGTGAGVGIGNGHGFGSGMESKHTSWASTNTASSGVPPSPLGDMFDEFPAVPEVPPLPAPYHNMKHHTHGSWGEET
jgi:hypothetical protein